MLLRASWFSKAMHRVGITGISQVWTDCPEWYLWIAGKPGPYNLALERNEEQIIGDQTYTVGYFSVKCFPEKNCPAYHGFSSAEKKMLSSPLFDNTGTPVYETKAQIPESFFVVGTLVVFAQPAGGTTVWSFDSLDSIRLLQKDPDRLLRNVAGWEIGYPLLDSLVCLDAFYRREGPCWFRMTKAPGFEHIQKNGNIEHSRPSRYNRLMNASILFKGPGMSPPEHCLPPPEPDEQVLVDICLDSKTVESNILPDIRINPLWLDLAKSDMSSGLASTCGCGNNCNNH